MPLEGSTQHLRPRRLDHFMKGHFILGNFILELYTLGFLRKGFLQYFGVLHLGFYVGTFLKHRSVPWKVSLLGYSRLMSKVRQSRIRLRLGPKVRTTFVFPRSFPAIFSPSFNLNDQLVSRASSACWWQYWSRILPVGWLKWLI